MEASAVGVVDMLYKCNIFTHFQIINDERTIDIRL